MNFNTILLLLILAVLADINLKLGQLIILIGAQ